MNRSSQALNKSVTINAVLNVIKNVLSLAFPLLTIPYISRILGPEALGQFQWSNSVISYFLLLAGLGVNTYAIREGSRFRNEYDKISRFSSEVYSINLYATLFAYILLFICFVFIQRFKAYQVLLLILSTEMILVTLGMTWLFTIFEDFSFMTLMSIVVQIAALTLMFVFVKTPEDVDLYAWFSVLAYTGDGLLLHFKARKYVHLRFVPKPNPKHWKPILIVFALNIGTTIYVSSDLTILGWIKGDYATGQYGIAANIYKVVKAVLNAVVVAVIPRFAYYVGKAADTDELKKNEYEKKAKDLASVLSDSMMTICLPAMTGLFFMSEPIVKVFAGNSYQDAVMPLRLLSLALVFAVFENYYGNCILISFKKETIVMLSTFISAALNIALNIVLVPFWSSNAAAFTTVVAEFVIMCITGLEAKKVLPLRIHADVLLKSAIGCTGIGAICLGTLHLDFSVIIKLSIGVALSLLFYVAIELLLKNRMMIAWMNNARARISRSAK